MYQILEETRDAITPLVSRYSLPVIYKSVLYSLVYTSLNTSIGSTRLLKPFESKIPPPLLAVARGSLHYKFLEFLRCLNQTISSNKPVIADGEANLTMIVDWVKHELARTDYVLMYDCMSVVEFLVISAYLQSRGVRTFFLSRAFVNPLGLTRFMTQQLHGTSYYEVLREVARYLADKLGGKAHVKSSYIDKKVHEHGAVGIDEFINAIDIENVADEILDKAVRSKLLVGTDHGYDIVLSREGNYIYVTHGFKTRAYDKIPLVLLSRIAIFMGTM